MTILITGAAGFNGAAVAELLLARGNQVVEVDKLNNYYDRALKQARLQRIQAQAADSGSTSAWSFHPLDIADGAAMGALFAAIQPRGVVHLAAQEGVRSSLENPRAYVQRNLVGMGHVLEGCRHQQVEHLVYVSSSSVYGGNRNRPFSERHSLNRPVSLYPATKKAKELMAHTYKHFCGLPTTGLSLFTVYGVGPSEYGADAGCRSDLGGRADPGLQPRPDATRLHLYRRHCRRSNPLP